MKQFLKCNQISSKYLEQTVSVNGWVKKVRKLGSLLFIDIKDITGIVQVVVENSHPNFDDLLSLSKESCIQITGVLKERKNKNLNLETGEYEIILDSYVVYSKALTTPFLIEDETDGLEEIRLKYRYLDLRRPINQKTIIARSKISQIIRNFLSNQNFIEIETPILSKQTPEGARDFLVPSRTGKFYALPQSPQIYKQLLMISGFEKYFQIAKCFRDEDLRNDRQFELTQIDIETSFSSQDELFNLVENMLKDLFNNFLNKPLKTPFQRMEYDHAMKLYGIDKPDLRYENYLLDLSSIFKSHQINSIINAKNANEFGVIGIFIEYPFEKQYMKQLLKFASDHKITTLNHCIVSDYSVVDNSFKKAFPKGEIENFLRKNKYQHGFLIYAWGSFKKLVDGFGGIRNELKNIITNFKLKEDFAFSWIINWPLFEWSEEQNRYVASHHPFTSPSQEWIDKFTSDPQNARSLQYDLVLNGCEVAGGSVRIFQKDLQTKMFKFLGLSESEIEQKFGFLLDAFNYGPAPCCGIAFGFDRLLMLLLKKQSIKEVIAFPKTAKGNDLLFNTPSDVDQTLLDELKLTKKQ